MTNILFFSGSKLLPRLVRFEGIFNLRKKINLDGWNSAPFEYFQTLKIHLSLTASFLLVKFNVSSYQELWLKLTSVSLF